MFFLRRELRRISGKLCEIASGDTNEKLTLNIADKDAAALAVSINAMLERNRRDLYQKNVPKPTLNVPSPTYPTICAPR